MNAAQYASVRGALVKLVSDSENDAANSGPPALDLSLSGYMHMLCPVAATLPPELLPAGAPTDNGALSGSQAHAVVDNVIQALANNVSAQITPQLPPLDAAASSLAQLADPLALNARNTSKPKPLLPVPHDEYMHPYLLSFLRHAEVVQPRNEGQLAVSTERRTTPRPGRDTPPAVSPRAAPSEAAAVAPAVPAAAAEAPTPAAPAAALSGGDLDASAEVKTEAADVRGAQQRSRADSPAQQSCEAAAAADGGATAEVRASAEAMDADAVADAPADTPPPAPARRGRSAGMLPNDSAL